jgi:hypothetical protein
MFRRPVPRRLRHSGGDLSHFINGPAQTHPLGPAGRTRTAADFSTFSEGVPDSEKGGLFT